MLKLRSLLIGITTIAIAMISIGAHASCDVNAKVTRVLLNPQGGTIIFQGSRDETYRWQGSTNRADIIALATAAQSGGTYLFVRGDAASCPNTGNVRNVGTLTHLGTGY